MNITDMKVMHCMGGMPEFDRTGIYPNYIVFSSRSLRRSWRFKLKRKVQVGVLKIKGVIAFNYKVTPSTFKIQPVKNGIPASDWQKIKDVGMILYD